jgi:large subunit ribosomal protein L30
MADATLKIQLISSPIGSPEKHKKIVRALGLHKMNQMVVKPDSPSFRGMARKVPHLLKIVE